MKNIFKCLFFCFFNCFFALKQITTDSYQDLEEICINNPEALIIIDLLDVGIEYISPLLHIENRKIVNAELKKKLVSSFKIREFVKSLEKLGVVEIDRFLIMYKKINSKSVLLMTDKLYYMPKFDFISLNLNYDSYKNGVLFYRGNFWLAVIEKLAKNYKKIIFVSSNKNKVKKFLDYFQKCGIGVLFLSARASLRPDDLDPYLIS